MYLSSVKKKKYILEILNSQSGKFIPIKDLYSQILSHPEFPKQIIYSVPEKIFLKELKSLVSENLIQKIGNIRNLKYGIRISNLDSNEEILTEEFINYFICHALEPIEYWINSPELPTLKQNEFKIIQFPFASSPYLKLVFDFPVSTFSEEQKSITWIIKPKSKKHPNGKIEAVK